MISLLHPSRSRAERSAETCNRWINRAGIKDIEVIISLDYDDPDLLKYKDLNNKARYYVRENRSAVDAINVAAQQSIGDIMIVVSDDTDCPENWATRLLEQIGNRKDFIAKCPDGIQPWLITMPVMDRTYYNRFGYVYYPEYRHMFCDTEISCVADLTGRRISVNIDFPHMHYSVGKSQKDGISKRADLTWQQGETLFLSRLKNKFDLKETPGRITDSAYINWAKSKGITI